MGLRSGETPLELNGDEVVLFVGDGLLRPLAALFLFIWLVMVDEMVALAACFALSVDTKLFTRSFRLPLTSGEARSSSDLPMGGPAVPEAALGGG